MAPIPDDGSMDVSSATSAAGLGTSRRRLFASTALVCLSPFLLIAAALYWMSTGSYMQHLQYPSLTEIGYGEGLHGANCDVVFDGDSTALVGIDPAKVEQQTGMKACNVAETAGVKTVNGNLILDNYLAQNKPPRYVVFFFAPENLTRPEGWNTVSLFEGVLYRLQKHPDASFAAYTLTHPDTVITSAELGIRTGAKWIFTRPLPMALGDLRGLHQGWLPDSDAPSQHCPVTVILRQPDLAWLASLRERYSAHGTRVLIDVAPEPTCAPDRSFYEPRLAHGVTDNAWWSLPLSDFSDSGRLHTTAAGSQAISAALGQQLATLERGR